MGYSPMTYIKIRFWLGDIEIFIMLKVFIHLFQML